MKKTILLSVLLAIATSGMAQDNHSYGAGDGDFKSLSEEVAKLKKHNDMFNVYFNYAASGQISQDANKDWGTRFANKQLRIEIKGNLTDKLYYRLRHRLNKANGAQSEDNFAKATDIMMVGYKFNDKLKIEAGKMCQIWGVVLSYKPVPTQELAFEISDAHNNKFATEYGSNPVSLEKNGVRQLKASRNPLTYIANWNGSFCDNKLLTRWSWGIQTQAEHKYSRMLVLGQQLNLPRMQWYFDYMGAFDGLDRLKIASSEATAVPAHTGESYFSDVHYNSFITKMNWQFAPQWNLMLKGMYETASVTKIEQMKDYRKSYAYMGSIEYYPVKSQDFRIFLAYIGRKYDYSKASGLKDYNTNRIEIGFMYRIKAY